MRRTYLLAGLATLTLTALGVLLASHFTSGSSQATESNAPAANNFEEKKTEEKAGKSPSASQVPVTQIVLFNSGVGYFQREGSVDGSQRIDLSYEVKDVNDLIKSMTLQDLNGGRVSAVSYDSTAPIERTLKSFAINLTGNPSFGDILNQARGEKVEVVLQQNNAAQPANLTGSVIGVEKKMQKVKQDVVNVEVINLWCADGMRSVNLSEVQRVRFLNAIMDTEFRKALETLALGHDTQKKTVSIHFTGEGKRKVRVSYVVESPVWKSSYRLVLSNKDEKKKPFLQSWAVVENTTDEDWDDVRMALISGRPISFKMNLYDPLFINRPTVEPELFASLRPPTYTGGLGGVDGTGLATGMPPPGAPMPNTQGGAGLGGLGGGLGGFAGGGAGAPGGGFPGNNRFGRGGPGRDDYRRKAEAALENDLDLKQGVASAAQASKLGDYYRYVIDHTVSLPRQKSAMIPILNQDVEATRVSIFNEMTHAKFPLLGLIFKNTSGSPLMQGPITVYEGSNYAGDARILDLQKGEQRLLSYAIDLGTEVQAVPHASNGRLTDLKIIKGILISKTRQEEKKTYTVKNRNEDARTMIIEHPYRSDFELSSNDKPWETARDVYRFKVAVPAGETKKLTVAEEKEFATRVSLTNSNDQSIKIFLESKVVTDKVKDALKEALARRVPLAQAQRDLTKLQQQLKDLNDDQQRLRRNLGATPREAKVYKRWLDKLDVQEVEIDKLRDGIKKAQDMIHRLQTEYDEFLTKLTVE